jgi:hypothetical protein
MKSIPPPALMALENFSLRRWQNDDMLYFSTLLAMEHNQAIIEGLVESDALYDSFMDAVKTSIWSIPMVCLHNEQPLGIMLTSVTDLQNLNARLIALFEDLQDARVPLLLYVRHLFWNFPLQRIYVQILASRESYIQLYQSVGFQQEGILPNHLILAGSAYDVVMLGLLRQDFDLWCLQNDQRFSLEKRIV